MTKAGKSVRLWDRGLIGGAKTGYTVHGIPSSASTGLRLVAINSGALLPELCPSGVLAVASPSQRPSTPKVATAITGLLVALCSDRLFNAERGCRQARSGCGFHKSCRRRPQNKRYNEGDQMEENDGPWRFDGERIDLEIVWIWLLLLIGLPGQESDPNPTLGHPKGSRGGTPPSPSA
jgi:hypothetical protein